jgi:hypothetical protein
VEAFRLPKEQGPRLQPVRRFDDRITGFAQDAASNRADPKVVVDQEDDAAATVRRNRLPIGGDGCLDPVSEVPPSRRTLGRPRGRCALSRLASGEWPEIPAGQTTHRPGCELGGSRRKR